MNVVKIIQDLLNAIPNYTPENGPAIDAGVTYIRRQYFSPDVATPMPKVFIPHGENNIEGVNWLLFYNEGTFDAYKAMPNGLEYKGRKYGKMGWNSDTHTVHYKEIPLAIAC